MSTFPPASQRFAREWTTFTDDRSGRTVWQVTSGPLVSSHIYPESMTFTPDGRRVVFWRQTTAGWPYDSYDLFLLDMDGFRVRQLTDEAAKGEGACWGPAVSADGRWVYYFVYGGEAAELRRICLESFEREAVCKLPAARRMYVLGTMTADGRYYCTGRTVELDKAEVLCVDLEAGEVQTIYASRWVYNPHPAFDPSGSGWLLVQENLDYELLGWGCSRMTGTLGARLIVMRPDGSDVRQLDVGRREGERIQGHQTWRGSSGEVVATVARRRGSDGPWAHDIVVGVTPDGQRRIVAAGLQFWHIGADSSGRWVCVDTVRGHFVYLIDVEQGRVHFVCASQASGGTAQWNHPHPAISPDGRWIVFNSDRTGVAQLYAVSVEDITQR